MDIPTMRMTGGRFCYFTLLLVFAVQGGCGSAAHRSKNWVVRGNRERSKTQWDTAIKYYNEAIRLNPKNADAYYGRGCVKHRTKDLSSAIEDFDTAIRFGRKDSSVYSSRGHSWKAMGKLDNALKDLDKAIQLDPSEECHYLDRSFLWERIGDDKKAANDLAEFERLSKKS